MKEQIIAILINHVRELAGHSWIMGIPKNDVDVVAEEIDALFKVAEMPTEEECDNRAVEISGGLKMYYEGFIKGCEWFRNRMKGKSEWDNLSDKDFNKPLDKPLEL